MNKIVVAMVTYCVSSLADTLSLTGLKASQQGDLCFHVNSSEGAIARTATKRPETVHLQ